MVGLRRNEITADQFRLTLVACARAKRSHIYAAAAVTILLRTLFLMPARSCSGLLLIDPAVDLDQTSKQAH